MLKSRSNVFGLLDCPTQTAARVCIFCEARIMQLAAVLRIAKKNDLLPLDLAQSIVLDDHYNDRQVVLDCGEEFAHQHRKAAVADEGNGLSFGKSKLGGNGIREPRRHSR